MAMLGFDLKTLSTSSAFILCGVALCVAGSPACAGDLDSPLLLQPRYNINSNSAPAPMPVYGASARTARPATATINGVTAVGLGRCAPVVSSQERTDCMMRGAAAADAQRPAASLAEISGAGAIAMPSVVVGEDAR
jgi:hypothetical protein